jgi:hypothetical protein
LIGAYSMGRIMGSTAAENAMNAQMQGIAGARGEQLAYQFMGQRLAGCATGNGPAVFGTMMGLMGTAMMGASYGSAYPNSGYGSSMMGGYGSNQTAGSSSIGTGTGTILALVRGVLLVVALIAWFLARRAPRTPTQPRPA